MSQPRYERPTSLTEAMGLLASGDFLPLAGGTDVHAAHVGRPLTRPVLDLGALPLGGIVEDDHGWRIGSATTWTALIAHPLPPAFDGLKAAAREVGGRQVQNAGTLGGNLCNASPAADGVPPLLALDAEVVLMSASGRRRLPLAAFVLGPRRTERRADELLVEIVVPRRSERARSAFLKLGARRHLVISIAMVGATLDVDAQGAIVHAGIAVGSCSAVACRLPALERKLLGSRAEAAASLVAASDLAPLTPMDDIRGSAAYRRDAALTLVRRALAALAVSAAATEGTA